LDDKRNSILLFNFTNEDSIKYMDLHFGIGLLDLAGVKYMDGSGTQLGALFTQTLKMYFWILGLALS
jgi:hypothetical protein